MRKIFFGILLLLGVLMPSGCTKGEYVLYEDGIACKVYFVQAVGSVLKTVTEASLDESGCVSYCIYCAGNNSDKMTVNVVQDQYALDVYNVENGLSLEMLPQKYWSLEKSTFVMDTEDNYQALVHVAVDFGAVRSDGLDVSAYVIPLSVETPSIADVNYDYRSIFIQLSLE